MSPNDVPGNSQRRAFPVSTLWGLVAFVVVILVIGLIWRAKYQGVEPSARQLSAMTGNESDVDVEDYVGTTSADGARDLTEAFIHPDPLFGKTIKVRGEVSEVVSPHLFTLARDELVEGEDVAVFDEAGMPEGHEVEAGDDIVVEGKVVKVDQAMLQQLVKGGLTELQATVYLGKPGIVVPAGAAVKTAH